MKARFRMQLKMQPELKNQEPMSKVQRNSNLRRMRPGYHVGIGSWRLELASMLAIGCWLFCVGVTGAATSAGLWVGEISLVKVNESVGGINAANQLVFQDPAIPTPVASAAHLRIIFHVDRQGQV